MGGKLPEFGVRKSTKHYLERFAPVVNDGCGGFRTLARDRRTLKGVHAFGLLRMTACFFLRDIVQELCR